MGRNMPRHRKYDYKHDYPVTIFFQVPLYLKRDFDDLSLSQRQINDIFTKFLKEYVEKNRKND